MQSRLERDVQHVARCLTMFEPLSEHPKRESLDLRHGLRLVGPVAHDPRETGNIGQPAAVLFSLEFDLEGHGSTVAPGSVADKEQTLSSAQILQPLHRAPTRVT